MESRERVTRAIEFECPDRIPIMHAFLPSAIEKYGERTVRSLFDKYPHDYADVYQYSTMSSDPIFQRGGYRDAWGCIWLNPKGGIMGQVTGHPLADWNSLEEYEFPNPLDDPYFEQVESSLKKDGHKKFYSVDYLCFFERMQWLRGYENLMIDLINKPKQLRKLAEGILDYNLKRIRRWGEVGVDEVLLADDLGYQRGLTVSPEVFHNFLKPSYEEMFDAVHKHDMFVEFHSDGYITEVLEDLIEMEADVLNIQMTIMGIRKLGELFGGKTCFRSDIDCQRILPFGTQEEVAEHVREIVNAFGRSNGGLILSGEIGENVPLSSTVAMYEAFSKYGGYPLKLM